MARWSKAGRMLAVWLLSLIAFAAAPAAIRADEPAASPAASAPATTSPQPVSFRAQIAPLLVERCLACHGPQDPKSDYQVTTFERVLRPGASDEAVVTAGKPEESLLYTLVASTDPDVRMPKDGDAFSADEVALVERWIREGAALDGGEATATLVSLVPKRPHADPPETYPVAVPAVTVAFRPDGGALAVGGYREVLLYQPNDGALVRRIKNVAERVYGLAWTSDGARLAVAAGVPGQLGEVRVYDAGNGALVQELGTMNDSALGVALSPNGARLAAAGADRSIRVYDLATGAQQLLIEDHADWVQSVAWSADGARLVSASRDKTSKVFDAANGEAQTTYSGHGQTVFSAVFSPDGAQVLSAGADRKVHIWNPADGNKIAEIGGFGHEVYRVLVADGQIFTCAADNLAQQFKLDSREKVRDFAGHTDWVFGLDYCPTAKRLASGSFDGQVRVWNTEDGSAVATFSTAVGLTAAAAAQVGQ